MKNGTVYAPRVKKAFASLRPGVNKEEAAVTDEPLDRLVLAALGSDCSDTEARSRVDRLRAAMVDWNEVRVSYPQEISVAAGLPKEHGLDVSERLIRILRSIYTREHAMSLDRLKSLPRREAKHYLEQLDGMDEYVAASVVLWSLGGHAIPVSEIQLAALRSAELVDPGATRAEVQTFLERHVSAGQGREFCLALRSVNGKAPAKPRAKAGKPAKSASTKKSAAKPAAKPRTKRSSA